MHFTKEEILDEFQNGKCVLTESGKFDSLIEFLLASKEGSVISIRDKRAKLHKVELGKRGARMLMTVTYLDEK